MILEDYGCLMPILPSWVALIIISIPPVVLEFIAGVYGCLSIHAFYSRSRVIETHNNLNPSRYMRLICFSVCDLLFGIPVALFYLYINIKIFVPFPGLTQEHYQFSQIIEVPAADWRATPLSELSYELNRWIIVWGAFVFFASFGFTEESRNNYRAAFQSVVKVFVKITGIKYRPSTGNKTEECVTFFSPCSLSDMLFRIIFYNSTLDGSTVIETQTEQK